MGDSENVEEPELLLTAFGNPNMDIIVELPDDSIIKKYNLQMDRTKTVDEKFLRDIEADFKKLDPIIRYSPGGCAQNTLKIFQWLTNSKFNSNMIGSVGDDEEGKFLSEELRKNGVLSSYTLKKDFKTGFLFMFIHENEVASVYGATCLASWQYSLSDFMADQRALDSVKKSKIILLEGFFVIHCAEVGREALKMCAELGTITSFNICGEYVVKSYPQIALSFVKACHIVIGNECEFKAVCNYLKICIDDMSKALLKLFDIMMAEFSPFSAPPIPSMKKHKKILIVTSGADLVYCVSGQKELIQYKVALVQKELVKDAIGAGDAFLAGIFHGLLGNKPMTECLELASRVAAEIVQQRGCSLPKKSSSTFF